MQTHIISDRDIGVKKRKFQAFPAALISLIAGVTGLISGSSVAVVAPTAVVRSVDDRAQNTTEQETLRTFVERFMVRQGDKLAVKHTEYARDVNQQAKSWGIVSEGMGYGSLIAVAGDDQKSAEELYATTKALRKTNGQNGKLGLLPWAFTDKFVVDDQVGGIAAALDAELDTLAAMIMMCHKYEKGTWQANSPEYVTALRQDIYNYAEAIKQYGTYTVQYTDGQTMTVLKPGDDDSWVFEDQTIRLYTSYFSPAWYRLIADFVQEDRPDLAETYTALYRDTFTLMDAVIAKSEKTAAGQILLPMVVRLSVDPEAKLNVSLEYNQDEGKQQAELNRLSYRFGMEQHLYANPRVFDLSRFDLTVTGNETINRLNADFAAGKKDLWGTLDVAFMKNTSYFYGTYALLLAEAPHLSVTGEKKATRAIDLSTKAGVEKIRQNKHPDARFVLNNDVLSKKSITDSANYLYSHQLFLISKQLLNEKDRIAYLDVATDSVQILTYLLEHSYGNMLYYAVPAYISLCKDLGYSSETIYFDLLRMERLRNEQEALTKTSVNGVLQDTPESLEWRKGAEHLRSYRMGFVAQEKYLARVENHIQELQKQLQGNEATTVSQHIVRVHYLMRMLQLQVSIGQQQKAVATLAELLDGKPTVEAFFDTLYKQNTKAAEPDYEVRRNNYRSLKRNELMVRYYQAVLQGKDPLVLEKILEDFDVQVVQDTQMRDIGTDQERLGVPYTLECWYHEWFAPEDYSAKLPGLGHLSAVGTNTPVSLGVSTEAQEYLMMYIDAVAENMRKQIVSVADVTQLDVPALVAPLLQDLKSRPHFESLLVFAGGESDVFEKQLIRSQHMHALYILNLLNSRVATLSGSGIDALKATLTRLTDDLQLQVLDSFVPTASSDADVELTLMPIFRVRLQTLLLQLKNLPEQSPARPALLAQVKQLLSVYPQFGKYFTTQSVAVEPVKDPFLMKLRDKVTLFMEVQNNEYQKRNGTMTLERLQKNHADVLKAIDPTQYFENYDKALANPKTTILRPKVSAEFLTRPETIDMKAWTNFRQDVIAKGFFMNVDNFAAFAGEVAVNLFWSNDKDLRELALFLMDSVVTDYGSTTPGYALAGIKNTQFFINYYSLNLFKVENSAKMPHGDTLESVFWQTFYRLDRTTTEKGMFSAEYIQLAEILLMTYDQGIADAGTVNTDVIRDSLFKVFDNLQKIDTNVDFPALAVSDQVNYAKVFAHAAALINDFGLTEYSAGDFYARAEQIVHENKNIDLFSGTQAGWLYLDLYKYKQNRAYLNQIYEFDKHTGGVLSQDEVFMKYYTRITGNARIIAINYIDKD